MPEEVVANIYRIKIPIPNNPLGTNNSYVVKGSEKNLIIDTGLNQKECLKALQAGLKEVRVDLKEADFFISHFHLDHIGLIVDLAIEAKKIYFNHPETDLIRSEINWNAFLDFALLNGFPDDEVLLALHDHPGFKFSSKKGHRIRGLSFHFLKQDDVINVGGYLFQCIETPGHSIGHMCLYEPNKKILISGDHILGNITPTIQLWSDEGDPLEQYLKSLDKIYGLDMELILPGHGKIIRNPRGRIQELKDHHQIRLEEILSILRKGRKTAFQVASQMSWDIPFDSWNLFPPLQKWFALGEATAHLKYLKGKRKVRRQIKEQKLIYSLA